MMKSLMAVLCLSLPAQALGQASTSAPAAAGIQDSQALRQPRSKSPSFDFQATGMAVADFKGDGTLQVALSDKKTVRLYPYPPTDPKPLAQFTHAAISARILSLEAADLKSDGRAQLFVTHYNENFTRLETSAVELDSGALKELAEFPGVVRGLQEENGRKILAVQQLMEDSTFPFSNIYPLVFEDGKFGPGKDALPHKRVEWVYDFTRATFDGEPAMVSLTSDKRLRVQFAKASWLSPEAYGQTPIRVRWQGRLLEFHPELVVDRDARGRAALYLVRNLSALGALSEPFGLFNGAELLRKSWDGAGLVDDWKAELTGYAAALRPVTPLSGPEELAVAVVGAAGKTSLWIYER